MKRLRGAARRSQVALRLRYERREVRRCRRTVIVAA